MNLLNIKNWWWQDTDSHTWQRLPVWYKKFNQNKKGLPSR